MTKVKKVANTTIEVRIASFWLDFFLEYMCITNQNQAFIHTSVETLSNFTNHNNVNHAPVLLVKETRVLGENHRYTTSYWQTLSHNAVSSIPCMSGIQNHNFVVGFTVYINELSWTYNSPVCWYINHLFCSLGCQCLQPLSRTNKDCSPLS
jgi:hypothetical protein